MKIAIATIQVPFVRGGAEAATERLRSELIRHGHQADIVTLPFRSCPTNLLLDSMEMGERLDLMVGEGDGEAIDLVIALKFPAYYLQHPNKVTWLFHQHRPAYELWGTEYADMARWENAKEARRSIMNKDGICMADSRAIFSISKNVASRLKKHNGLDATPLYHPPPHNERFYCQAFEDFVFYPSRLYTIKRQQLLVEAARHLRSGTKIYIAGSGPQTHELQTMIHDYGLAKRVKLLGHVSVARIIDYYSRCLMVYFGPHDEDYGYVTLEAFLSSKPVLTHTDSGGPLEFVEDGKSGFIVPPDPVAVAARIDELSARREMARHLGEQGHKKLQNMDISWDTVVQALTGHAQPHKTGTGRTQSSVLSKDKKTLLYIGPAPQHGATAGHSEQLIQDLGKLYDVTLLSDTGSPPVGSGHNDFQVLIDHGNVPFEDYDHVLYSIGHDSQVYSYVYDVFLRHPGPVILHDLDFDLLTNDRKNTPAFYTRLYKLGGAQAVAAARRLIKSQEKPQNAYDLELLPPRVFVANAPVLFVNCEDAMARLQEARPQTRVVLLDGTPREPRQHTGTTAASVIASTLEGL